MEGRELETEPQVSRLEKTIESLPAYPQEKFDTNFPKWKQMIQDGEQPAETIIRKVQTKNTLNDEQIRMIRAVKVATTAPIEGDVMTEEEVAAIREREMYEATQGD